jgi:signal transduction histidine kinase
VGPAALEYFQAVAQSDDPSVRANALLDLARTQSALGRHQAALATYRGLQDPDVLVAGRPAELWARLAVCELLDDLKATAEFSNAVRQLDADLHGGRWQLTRAAYQNYAAEVRRLRTAGSLPAGPTLPTESAQAIAAGVDFLWSQWQEQGLTRETAASRITRVWNGQPLFLLWRATAERFVALVAGPGFVQDRVVEPVKGLADRQRVRVLLEDGEGRTVPSLGAIGPATLSEVRTMVETRLPWTLRVVSANTQTDEAEFSTRRQLVIAGLVFLALFVSAGSYLSVRAMTREMEAVQLKSDFVAAVSHEFRTPLTLLRQFSDMLVDDRVSSEQERRRYYAALQRGTRRLTRLVEDLLDFGRMEAGSRAYRFQRLDALQWFTSVTKEFADEVHNKGYRLDLSWTCPTGLVLQADEEAIGRAFWNLLDNAVKYSPACKTIWVSADFEGGRVTIGVRDQGVGVPIDEQQAIFRKFVRGSTTNTQVVRGTGLGLALVEQIVEAHGGQVRLVSAVGEGSTFSIVLPAVIEEQEQEQEQEQSKWLAS